MSQLTIFTTIVGQYRDGAIIEMPQNGERFSGISLSAPPPPTPTEKKEKKEKAKGGWVHDKSNLILMLGQKQGAQVQTCFWSYLQVQKETQFFSYAGLHFCSPCVSISHLLDILLTCQTSGWTQSHNASTFKRGKQTNKQTWPRDSACEIRGLCLVLRLTIKKKNKKIKNHRSMRAVLQPAKELLSGQETGNGTPCTAAFTGLRLHINPMQCSRHTDYPFYNWKLSKQDKKIIVIIRHSHAKDNIQKTLTSELCLRFNE